MKSFIFALFLPFLSVACLDPSQAKDKAAVVESMASSIEKQYAEIPHITVDEYLKNKEESVLVDVRTSEEQSVSMIPGALTYDEFLKRKESLKKSGKQIVTYCTIGVRSSKKAQALKKEGFNSANLKGSILGWTHDQKNLVTPQGQKTKQVHVYDEPWNLAADSFEAIWDK